MTCQEFEELSGAFALDAITAEERKAAEKHLTGCPKCRQLQRTLTSVVDLLPLAAPQIEPSAALKGRIFATINAQPQPEGIMPQLSRTPQIVREPVTMPVRQQRRMSWQQWGTPLVAAAAILMLLLAGGISGWNMLLQQQIIGLQGKNYELQGKLDKLSNAVPIRYTMQGTSEHQGATGEVLYYREQNMTMVVVHGLPALKGNKVYQGWLLHGQQPVSVGLFNVENGVATLGFLGDVKDFDGAAVSVEPGPQGSLEKPQGPILAVGSLRPATA